MAARRIHTFLGSVHESVSARNTNYELLWEDDSAEAVAWLQAEFDALWNDARAVDLSVYPFIRRGIDRIIRRTVVEPEELKKTEDTNAAAAAVAGSMKTMLNTRPRVRARSQKARAALASCRRASRCRDRQRR